MNIGNETAFHLKPIPYRGTRKHEVEVLQHPPGYRHPITPSPTLPVAGSNRPNPFYLSEADRLDADTTVDAALKREEIELRTKQDRCLQSHRRRIEARETALKNFRDAEFSQQQRRLCDIAGTSRKNREENDQDVITHQCHTVEAAQSKAHATATSLHRYYARQRVMDQHINSSGCNIITWEPRPAVQVPPLPEPLPPQP